MKNIEMLAELEQLQNAIINDTKRITVDEMYIKCAFSALLEMLREAARNDEAKTDNDYSSYSRGTSYSSGTSHSDGTSDSYGTAYSFGINDCKGVYNSAFCNGKDGIANCVFNRKCTEKRASEIIGELRKFNYFPKFTNSLEVKGNKPWSSFCFPRLKENDTVTAWADMPQEMLDYIRSLPEFDAAIFEKITGIKS